jgi:flavin-binding protein dodecin
MAIIKVIEIMSNSTKSWEDAAQQAIHEASKTIKGIRSLYIKEHSAAVDENNRITEYRITSNLSFEVETPEKSVTGTTRKVVAETH